MLSELSPGLLAAVGGTPLVSLPELGGGNTRVLESASHQIPLAKNVVWPTGELDAIDQA